MAGILLKIRRQDDPDDLPYWELFEVERTPGMTVAAALRAIAETPVTAEGNATAPVVWDCGCSEGLCGACAMLIGGQARLACRTFIEGEAGPIVVEPLSSFPLIRDLRIDRERMIEALLRHECWVATDTLESTGTVPRAAAEDTARFGRYQDCILCGACSEACPQVNARTPFAGAFLFSAILALNRNSVGRMAAGERLAALGGRGGIADCAGAENCDRVCPRGIPLVAAAAMLSWDVLRSSVRQFFRGMP
jgi:succinate dehydrogenase / fumarate reductase, iron-sulfur subunit